MKTTFAIQDAFRAVLFGKPDAILSDQERELCAIIGQTLDDWAAEGDDPKPARDLRILADALNAAANALDPEGKPRDPYAAVNVHGGCVQDGRSTHGSSPDVLDWDNYDDCQCDPEENVYDPECGNHDAEEVGYDHALMLFLSGKAGPPNMPEPAKPLEPDTDD